MTENKSGCSSTFGKTLFAILLVLKLTDLIGLSWWWVFAPIWAPIAFMVLLVMFVVIVFIVSEPSRIIIIKKFDQKIIEREKERLSKMNFNETNSNSSIMKWDTILFVIFLILKLTGSITWSWWWITSPLWIPVVLYAVALMVIMLVFWAFPKFHEATMDKYNFDKRKK